MEGEPDKNKLQNGFFKKCCSQYVEWDYVQGM